MSFADKMSDAEDYPVYNHDNNTITLSFQRYADLVKKLYVCEQKIQQIESLLKGDEEE